ncbi:SDR family NAD(P)-dependent oxidoreductase [Monashia sp. NPDC004114]
MAIDTGLAGRSVLVTGGAAGIGAAIARRFAREGAHVTIADRDEVALARTADEIALAGGVCDTVGVDLADAAARGQVVARTVAAHGSLDVLVNNAATVGDRLGVGDLTEDDWDRVLTTNLKAAAFLSQDAAAVMRPGATIVNVSAIQEYLPLEGHISYIASKGGVSALTRALAVELAPRGIRVNSVVPGCIESPGMQLERDRNTFGETVGNTSGGTAQPGAPASAPVASLLRRMGLPSEVAEAVLFLASDGASFITGAALHVDGGRRMSRRPDGLTADPTPTRVEGSA